MSDTVKIRYIGPLTEGVWTPDGEHGAHDFEHGEFVDVPVGLAVDLMQRCEPVPPGDPVLDEKTGQMVVKLAPVWELGPGEVLPEPDPPAEPESETSPKPAARVRKGGRR